MTKHGDLYLAIINKLQADKENTGLSVYHLLLSDLILLILTLHN